MNTFDLQMHSTASDGALRPAELVKKAKELNIATIAMTDHDTVAGLGEAVRAGQEFGVEVIPGIEFSCEHNGLGLHILGYGIDWRDPVLVSSTEKILETRVARAREMVRRLQVQGFSVDFEKVAARARGGSLGRPHVAYEVLDNPSNRRLLGEIRTKGDFIKAFLVPGKPAYVAGGDFSSREAIDLIHRARGAAVWSHPAVHFPETFDGLELALRELIAMGLEGIEVFNYCQTESAVRFLNGLAEKYGLLRTAGSDFEREPLPGEEAQGPASIGDFPTYGLPTADILPRLKETVARKSAG